MAGWKHWTEPRAYFIKMDSGQMRQMHAADQRTLRARYDAYVASLVAKHG